LTHPVVDEELDLLARVSERLRVRPPTKTAREEPIVRELERIRAQILSGTENKDLSALTEQYHNQSAILNQLRSAAGGPAVDPRSPYFAHLRLAEGGHERDLCLGHATCIEKGVRIVDWRDAPISKIFYSYRQGDEYDEEIAGRERIGEVVARRMVRIRDAALDRVQAPEGDFVADPSTSTGWRIERTKAPRLSGGEGAAFHFHEDEAGAGRRFGSSPGGEAMRADKRLPEITGLIDPDQFELITRPRAGFVVIRGAAGSGKTTVALHRVAYLAFDQPALDGPDTLVVVFSRALQRFVERVLPSLGLERVRVESYREWAAGERRRHFPRLPTRQREDTSSLVQRVKLHPFMSAALERHIDNRPGEASWLQVVDDWASLMVDREALLDAARVAGAADLGDADLKRFVEDQHPHVERVLSVLAGEIEPDAELDFEDDALLLRAWQLRVGPLRMAADRAHALRHLVIDEVQDFSPVEVQVLLGCLAPQATITLAGDTQQSVIGHSGFTSWSEFFGHLGLEGTELETLRVSYRSSRRVMSFAHTVLGPLAEESEPPETTREGPPVELFRFADRGACVAFLADALRELAANEPMASVAIVAPDVESGALYFDGLARCELPRLRHVVDQDFSFEAGVEVTDVEQVKGLEFDYVIVVDVDATRYPDSDPARRRLHVAATRAIHQLWLTCLGTPSPMVGEHQSANAAADRGGVEG